VAVVEDERQFTTLLISNFDVPVGEYERPPSVYFRSRSPPDQIKRCHVHMYIVTQCRGPDFVPLSALPHSGTCTQTQPEMIDKIRIDPIHQATTSPATSRKARHMLASIALARPVYQLPRHLGPFRHVSGCFHSHDIRVLCICAV